MEYADPLHPDILKYMTAADPPSVDTVRCIASNKLAHFLQRDARSSAAEGLDLRLIFRRLLERANDFLPSEAGTIYLDDPLDRGDQPGSESLVVIASFGPKTEDLVEERFSSRSGIIGEVYRSGSSYAVSNPLEDPVFLSAPGLRIGFNVDSVICAPLEVDGQPIGVIELLNHRGGSGYSPTDISLLGIFAQTISLSIVNAIDAHQSKEIAKRDDLTDLYNDRYLHSRLSEIIDTAIKNGFDCGVIFLDLDHFKEVNDAHGHMVGSRLLREVGATLKQIIPGNGLTARYGGDEFVIALPGAGRQETYWVAETIRQNIADAVFRIESDPETSSMVETLSISGVVTCSIGLATLQADVLAEIGDSSANTDGAKDILLRKADTCMYAAKELGRNRTIPYWELKRRMSPEGGE